MVDRALRHRPNAKWFVFIEADTYLVWPNLLEYLITFDANKAFYIGKYMYIGDVLFAHGGSGFALSNSAMRKVVERRNANLEEYNDYTTKNWAGDMVLGKILRDVDVQLFWAWPHFQGDPASSQDQNVSKVDRTPWCYPPITYHHMRSDDIWDLWVFYQARRQREPSTLLHRDVFVEFIVPKLASRVNNWDNLCTDSQPRDQESLEKCRMVCEAHSMCMQYSYTDGKCSISSEVKYGIPASTSCLEYSASASKCIRWQEKYQGSLGVQSGWVLERIPKYGQDMDSTCRSGRHNIWVT